MPEFLDLLPTEEALQKILDLIVEIPECEWIDTTQSLNRITFENIIAPHPLPTFTRSTVDGYAVRASDTYGASESLPGYLKMVGEILMGTDPKFPIKSGECALIHTGGMLPPGANAVIMIENTQLVSHDEIEISRSVADGENILNPGEDVKEGDVIIPAGIQIRPQEIGGLTALGITKVAVHHKPKIAILSSGDEIVAPSKEIKAGQVRDINSYTLQALIAQAGGEPILYGILPDNMKILASSARKALQECSMVVFTAGSSASERDLTAEVINGLGKPGVLVHGVNIRPGKPTILAACAPNADQHPKAVIGLPGNPVSALVIARLFVIPVLRKLLGLGPHTFDPTISAKLSINLPSQTGREDWVPVSLKTSLDGYIAEPVFGKSNLIFTLSRADGLIRIPPDATGAFAGSTVQVHLI